MDEIKEDALKKKRDKKKERENSKRQIVRSNWPKRWACSLGSLRQPLKKALFLIIFSANSKGQSTIWNRWFWFRSKTFHAIFHGWSCRGVSLYETRRTKNNRFGTDWLSTTLGEKQKTGSTPRRKKRLESPPGSIPNEPVLSESLYSTFCVWRRGALNFSRSPMGKGGSEGDRIGHGCPKNECLNMCMFNFSKIKRQ